MFQADNRMLLAYFDQAKHLPGVAKAALGRQIKPKQTTSPCPRAWGGNSNNNQQGHIMEISTQVLGGGQLPSVSVNLQPGERALALLLNATPTSQLIPSFDSCINTAKALIQMAGLPVEVARHLAYSDIPCYAVIDPVEQTVSRIMAFFRGVLANGATTPFMLSSESLQDVVRRIDHMFKPLGQLYQRRLRQECDVLLPAPLDESSPLEALARSFQNLRLNWDFFQCRFIGVALALCAMFRFSRVHPPLAFADWTPFIVAVQTSPVEWMPTAMAQAIQEMLNQLRAQNLSLEELGSLLHPQNFNNEHKED